MRGPHGAMKARPPVRLPACRLRARRDRRRPVPQK